MTLEELEYINNEADRSKTRLSKFLKSLLSVRHSLDKVFRCLYCGTCIPVPKESIYSEFCDVCKSKI